MNRFLRITALAATTLTCVASLAQSPAPVAPTATASASTTIPSAATDPSVATLDLSALKSRAQAYYDAMFRGDRSAAAQYVAAECQNQFASVNYTGLRSAIVEQVAPQQDGSAVVTVKRVQIVPGFGSMEYPASDIWKPTNGQWYLWFAPPQPPFPMAQPSAEPANKNSPAVTDEELKARIARAERNIDPDQYMLQLRKAMQADAQRQAELQAQEEAAKKAQQAQIDANAKSSKKRSKKKPMATQK